MSKRDSKTSCIEHSVLPRLVYCLSLIISKVFTFHYWFLLLTRSFFLNLSDWSLKNAGPDKNMNSLLHRKCLIHTVLTVLLSARLSVLSLMWSWNILCFTTFPYSHPKATDLNIQLTCLETSPHDYTRKKSMPNGPNVLIKHVVFMYTLWNENRLHSLQFWLVSLAWFTWTNLSTALVEAMHVVLVEFIELLAQIGVFNYFDV